MVLYGNSDKVLSLCVSGGSRSKSSSRLCSGFCVWWEGEAGKKFFLTSDLSPKERNEDKICIMGLWPTLKSLL